VHVKVPGYSFNTRRQTDVRTERVELEQRDILNLQTNNLTNRGTPVRFLQDLANLMSRRDLENALKTNGFYQGDDT
jgi:hypothetical protein